MSATGGPIQHNHNTLATTPLLYVTIEHYLSSITRKLQQLKYGLPIQAQWGIISLGQTSFPFFSVFIRGNATTTKTKNLDATKCVCTQVTPIILLLNYGYTQALPINNVSSSTFHLVSLKPQQQTSWYCVSMCIMKTKTWRDTNSWLHSKAIIIFQGYQSCIVAVMFGHTIHVKWFHLCLMRNFILPQNASSPLSTDYPSCH